MKTILALGPYRFVLPSAAIAHAIAEALRDAPQVESQFRGSDESTRYVPAPEARRMDWFHVAQAKDDAIQGVTPTPPTPSVRALLDQPPKARRETRRVLAEAAGCRR
ncbi:MAG: hypothetical protein J0L84_02075 [Verrucomicrobia bacterium]|nr:hypothetical protein [Verrucomicrobiota bacterium]